MSYKLPTQLSIKVTNALYLTVRRPVCRMYVCMHVCVCVYVCARVYVYSFIQLYKRYICLYAVQAPNSTEHKVSNAVYLTDHMYVVCMYVCMYVKDRYYMPICRTSSKLN